MREQVATLPHLFLFREHLALTPFPLLVGVLISVPVGVLCARSPLAQAHSRVKQPLLAGRIYAERMRRMNQAVDGQGCAPRAVAEEFLLLLERGGPGGKVGP